MTNDQCPNCGAAKRRDLNEYGRIEYECGSCCHGIIPNTGEQAGPYITDDCQLRAARAEVARLRAVVRELRAAKFEAIRGALHCTCDWCLEWKRDWDAKTDELCNGPAGAASGDAKDKVALTVALAGLVSVFEISPSGFLSIIDDARTRQALAAAQAQLAIRAGEAASGEGGK